MSNHHEQAHENMMRDMAPLDSHPNPGNFANRRAQAVEAGRKGGKNHARPRCAHPWGDKTCRRFLRPFDDATRICALGHFTPNA